MSRYRLSWVTADAPLRAIEPTPEEVAHHAPALVAAYNEPANARLLGHTDPLDEADVIAHYARIAADGHGFLAFRDDTLIGDADLRGVGDGAAEFAFLIAAVAAQGKGLGTQLATMVHAFGFRELDLTRIYASIVPHNTASRRVFDKLGYVVDTGPEARLFADEPGDITLRLDRAAFERMLGSWASAIEITLRTR